MFTLHADGNVILRVLIICPSLDRLTRQTLFTGIGHCRHLFANPLYGKVDIHNQIAIIILNKLWFNKTHLCGRFVTMDIFYIRPTSNMILRLKTIILCAFTKPSNDKRFSRYCAVCLLIALSVSLLSHAGQH